MKEFDQARLEYERTPLPPELDKRVQAGIREGKALRRRRRMVRRLTSCAACFAVLLAALNLSPTLAKAAADVPVLGGLFRVMTFVNYEETEDGIHYDVNVPQVENGGDLAETVNAVIQEQVDLLMERAKQDWADYRDAFLPPAAPRRNGAAGKWMSLWITRSCGRPTPRFPLWLRWERAGCPPWRNGFITTSILPKDGI